MNAVARKKGARKSASKEEKDLAKAQKEHNPATLPSDGGARQPDPRSPSTRARNAIQGAEIETASGPQEVGPARGARRPYTETLPGARQRRPLAIPVPTEEDEKLAERRKRVLEERRKLDEEEGEQVLVVATRLGFYGKGAAAKRYRAGDQFYMTVPHGRTVQEEAAWVEPVEEFEAARDKALGVAGKRAAKQSKARAEVAKVDAEVEAEEAEDRKKVKAKGKSDDDVL